MGLASATLSYVLNRYSRSHTNTNNVFRLVNPVYAMDMYIFKVTVFKK